jgi:ADP-heptose:LPS heptosyltransferase
LSPQVRVDVLGTPANAELLRRVPYVHTVHVFDKKQPRTFLPLARQLRRERYDAVVDGMITSRSMTGLLMMLATGAPHRVGFAGRGVDAELTLPVRGQRTDLHIIDLLSTLATALGVDPARTDYHPELEISEEERQRAEDRWYQVAGGPSRRMLVNVSAGKRARDWPEERYVGVVRAVRKIDPGLGVAVIGAPADRERVARIAAGAGVFPVETPRLGDAIALVATADLVFTPDTSVAHMASAFRKPAVVMYLKETAGQWGLYGTAGSSLESEDDTLESLHPEPVISALESLLRAEGSDIVR